MIPQPMRVVLAVLFLWAPCFPLYSQNSSEPESAMARYNHPYYDEVWAATSQDGKNYRNISGPIFRHASVPEVVELDQDLAGQRAGSLLLYFVDFNDRPGPGEEQISLSTSRDGKQWSDAQNISMAGRPFGGAAVDPSTVQLEDGRLRMYFFGSELNELGDPANQRGPHKIYSAVSKDGLNFMVEPGVRFEGFGITDPEVIFTGKEWLMFLSKGQETFQARSKDGLEFIRDKTAQFLDGGVPGAVMLPDGKVRVFLTRFGSIYQLDWDPDTSTYDSHSLILVIDKGKGLIVSDPSCVRKEDGSYYFIFKYKNPDI